VRAAIGIQYHTKHIELRSCDIAGRCVAATQLFFVLSIYDTRAARTYGALARAYYSLGCSAANLPLCGYIKGKACQPSSLSARQLKKPVSLKNIWECLNNSYLCGMITARKTMLPAKYLKSNELTRKHNLS